MSPSPGPPHSPPPAALSLSDAQVATSNETLNRFLGGHRPAWITTARAAPQPATPSAGPPANARRPRGRPKRTDSSRSGAGYIVPLRLQQDPVPMQASSQQGTNTFGNSSTLPSPAPTSEPSPADNRDVPIASGAFPDAVAAPDTSRTVVETRLSSGPFHNGTGFVEPTVPQAGPASPAYAAASPNLGQGLVPNGHTSPVLQAANNPSHVSGPPHKRPRIEGTTASPTLPSPSESLTQKWRITVDNWIQSHGGYSALDSAVERPRFRMLEDACRHSDFFYIYLHRWFCTWSINASAAHSELKSNTLIPAAIDTAFKLLLYVLRSNDQISPDHLAWLAQFPTESTIPVEQTPARSQVIAFLSRFASCWTDIVANVEERKYPLLAWEVRTILQCSSSKLQWVLFTVSRRRLGIKDGPLSDDLDNFFLSDMDADRRLESEGWHQGTQDRVTMARDTMASRYKLLLAQNPGNLVSQGGPASQTVSVIASPNPLQFSQTHHRLPVQTVPQLHNPPWHGPQYSMAPSLPGSQVAMQSPGVQFRGYIVPAQVMDANTFVRRQQGEALRASSNQGQGRPLFPGSGYNMPNGYVPMPLASPALSAPVSPTPFSPAYASVYGQVIPASAQSFSPQIPPGPGTPPLPRHVLPSHHHRLSNDQTSILSQDAARNTPTQSQSQALPRRPSQQLLQRALSGNIRQFSTSQQSQTGATSQIQGHHNARRVVNPNQAPSRPRPVPSIPEAEYPSNSYDWSSVRPGLHLVNQRSPKRAPAQPVKGRFYQFIAAMAVRPSMVKPQPGIQAFEFYTPPATLSRISRTTDSESLPICRYFDGSQRYRLRLCVRSDREPTEIQDSDWVLLPNYWPEHIHISFNNQPLFARRKQHFHHDLPIELTDWLVEGRNVVHVSLPQVVANIKKGGTYYIAVEMIITASHETLKRLCEAKHHIHIDVTKQDIAKRLKPSDSDDVVVEDDTLSVRVADPFTSRLFRIPARGKYCKHLECFDLDTWLETRPRKPPRKANDEPCMVDVWKCPICDRDARPRSLQIDDFFMAVQENLRLSGRCDTKSIRIKADGSWVAVSEPDDSDDEADGIAKTYEPTATPGTNTTSEIIEILDD